MINAKMEGEGEGGTSENGELAAWRGEVCSCKWWSKTPAEHRPNSLLTVTCVTMVVCWRLLRSMLVVCSVV